MSVNVFPLSHQAVTIPLCASLSHAHSFATDAVLHFYTQSPFCRAIQIGRLQWYILR